MGKLFISNFIKLYTWDNDRQVIPADYLRELGVNNYPVEILGYNLSSVIDTVNKTIDLNSEWKDKFIIHENFSDSVSIKFLKQVISDDKRPDEKYYRGRYEISLSDLLTIDFMLTKIVPYNDFKNVEYKIIYRLHDNVGYVNTKTFNNIDEFEKVLAEDIFAIAKIRITKFMNKLKENPEHRLDYINIFKDKEVPTEVMNILELKY